MVKKTPTPRATRLNKETKSKKLDEKKVEKFLKQFLKTTDKEKIISPPTDFEKALIIQEPGPIRIKTPKKVILPEFIENAPCEPKSKSKSKSKSTKKKK